MLEFGNTPGLVALLAIPIAWLLLRLPTQRFVSERVALWRKAMERLGRKPRRLAWRRIVMALAALFLALGIARLRVPAVEGVRARIAVFDASASMFVRDDQKRSRLWEAVQHWRREAPPAHVQDEIYALVGPRLARVDSAGDADSVDAVEAAATLVERVRELRASAASAGRVTDPARVGVVQNFAQRATRAAHVVFYGDGAGPSSWASSRETAYRSYGFGYEDAANTAITAVEVEDPWPGPELTLRLELTGRSVESVSPVARLVIEREGLARTEHDLPPRDPGAEGGRDRVELRIARGSGGTVTLTLLPHDALRADSVVKVAVRAPWAPVLWFASDPDSSTSKTASMSTMEVYLKTTLGAVLASSRDAFSNAQRAQRGLVVRDGGRLDAWPRDRAVRLLFGTKLPGLAGDRSLTGIPTWDRSDALLEGLDLSGFRAPRVVTRNGELPVDAEVLLELQGAPLIVRSRAHRLLWVGLRLDLDLVTRPALPLLVLRCLRDLAPEKGAAGSGSRVLSALLPAAESAIGARPAPRPQHPEPQWWRPAIELWQYALGLAAICILLLALF